MTIHDERAKTRETLRESHYERDMTREHYERDMTRAITRET